MFAADAPVAARSKAAAQAARVRQRQLTKPPGSLGMLEDLAVRFAGWQGCVTPVLERVAVRVFAADHGVCAHGISAFPQAVTCQMIANFCAGGAAISVLSRAQGFDFAVWNMGTIEPVPAMPGLIDRQVAAGSADICRGPAMTAAQLRACLQAGWEAVPPQAQLFIGGEMGIGNTTAAAALMAALYDLDGAAVAGAGTGLDAAGVAHKTAVIDTALARHRGGERDSLSQLRCLGGLEIAALVGAFLGAAQRGVPVLVDGFIGGVALACAARVNPGVLDWTLFAHCSAERAHRDLLRRLDVRPLLDLDMRLGEGSGAALAVPILRQALALHSGMATFAAAGVSDKQGSKKGDKK
ncbi:MAG: nicotinate-nucleotide--dimethylbenzimidazole phosphoribosyltransferase [Cellvibrionales bacterium]|nr:nicotinate-nucleotide--dimethylbenzimidazole phosphoribosyltransferase [Cellvibrionales bacterium]